ncbi:unnamed protein product [Rotaria sp. Silwood2]|nr:unnamed protein product [Rotaria sp. Silwood2]CAF3987214.1 unnamed protein product [Rotaria sp. Silwood2]
MTVKESDPEARIIKNCYSGYKSDGFMHLHRCLSIQGQPTLLQVRAVLHNQIGINDLFREDGRTITHEEILLNNEYLAFNRSLSELKQHALLDLSSILP